MVVIGNLHEARLLKKLLSGSVVAMGHHIDGLCKDGPICDMTDQGMQFPFCLTHPWRSYSKKAFDVRSQYLADGGRDSADFTAFIRRQ